LLGLLGGAKHALKLCEFPKWGGIAALSKNGENFINTTILQRKKKKKVSKRWRGKEYAKSSYNDVRMLHRT